MVPSGPIFIDKPPAWLSWRHFEAIPAYCVRRLRAKIRVVVSEMPRECAGPSPSLRRSEVKRGVRGTDTNITIMPYTPDPRLFYRTVYSATKILLMPSLWEEAFGLVAAEAMLNGIPVLGSNRGALPDTLGKGGFVFDIPERYTPETRLVPSAEEVEPWVETIIRLWDDAAFYEQASQAARQEAQRWHPDRIAAAYRDFFSSIHHQPGPPIMPNEIAG
jgi:glycosyltransferase involved in cell wall biosynthesis